MTGLSTDSRSGQLLHAAEAGNVDAMLTIAEARSRDGNVSEAEVWLSRSAEAGDTRGMHRLAEMFRRRGRIDEAVVWYVRAADQVRRTGW